MFNEYIDGEYLVREYESGTIVRTLISQETEGEIIELPPNPLIKLQQENAQLKEVVDTLILDNLNMQMQIDTLITSSLGGM